MLGLNHVTKRGPWWAEEPRALIFAKIYEISGVPRVTVNIHKLATGVKPPRRRRRGPGTRTWLPETPLGSWAGTRDTRQTRDENVAEIEDIPRIYLFLGNHGDVIVFRRHHHVKTFEDGDGDPLHWAVEKLSYAYVCKLLTAWRTFLDQI